MAAQNLSRGAADLSSWRPLAASPGTKVLSCAFRGPSGLAVPAGGRVTRLPDEAAATRVPPAGSPVVTASGGRARSGGVLGQYLPKLGDEPERVVVAALEDVPPEDQARRAGFHRLAGLLQHGLVARMLSAGDEGQRAVGRPDRGVDDFPAGRRS